MLYDNRFREAVGERITDRLHEQGRTQAALAEALDVSQPAVSFWARGQRPIPIRHLVAIARELDVTVAFLVGEETLTEMLNRQNSSDTVSALRVQLAAKDAIIRHLRENQR